MHMGEFIRRAKQTPGSLALGVPLHYLRGGTLGDVETGDVAGCVGLRYECNGATGILEGTVSLLLNMMESLESACIIPRDPHTFSEGTWALQAYINSLTF